MKLIIDDSMFDLFPNLTLTVLVARGIKQAELPNFADQLQVAQHDAHDWLGAEDFKDNLVVSNWRQAYTQFKTKKGARSSIEALLKRVQQGKEIHSINAVVDLYNSISLKFGLPVGAEDLKTIQGDLHLGISQGGESFMPLGSDHDEPALVSEVIYYDNIGAIVRSFNWREGQRTMITEDTEDMIFVLETLGQDDKLRAQQAVKLIEDVLTNKGETNIFYIDTKERTIELLS